MPPFDLGHIVNLAQPVGAQPPASMEGIAAAAEAATDDNKEVAAKAVQDSKETPSVWFVNFPNKEAAEQQKKLAEYMQNVEDYRCWASLTWWRTVFSQPKIPQDGSQAAIATRSAYCARVAAKHMQMTPWLAMSVNVNESKAIECQTTEFHTELIQAVLAGFVGVTPGIIAALEGILESLRRTLGQSNSNTEDRTIICERYEYIPQADVIQSYVRVISFSVNDSIKNVQNAKKTETHIKCKISYNDYEASFNQKLWADVSKDIDQEQKQAADDFRKQQTIDCPP